MTQILILGVLGFIAGYVFPKMADMRSEITKLEDEIDKLKK